MRVVEVRTLKRRLRLNVPDERAFQSLSFIDCRPDIRDIPATEMSLSLEPVHGFYRLTFPTDHMIEGTADFLLSALHIHHFNESLREMPDTVVIHGGTIQTEGGTILVVGDKGDGKSTLLAHLALGGMDVCGDEHAFLSEDHIVARPRTLRLKEGTMAHLPGDAVARIRSRPQIRDWYGDPIYSVPPSLFLDEWVIRPDGVRAVVLLTPNHGGRSRLRQIDKTEALPLLMRNTSEPQGDKLKAFMRLNRLCTDTPLFALRNGNLADAERLMHSLAN